MARLGVATSVKTLGRFEGLAGLRPADFRYTVRRAALTALSIGALIAGLAATIAAMEGVVDPGVASDLPPGQVTSIDPTGYAWKMGIREGQTVTDLESPGEGDVWRMETTDGRHRYIATLEEANRELLGAKPMALLAVAAGMLAILFLRTRRRWVLPVVALAFVAASVPIDLRNNSDADTYVMAAAALVPSLALARRLPDVAKLRWFAWFGLGCLALVWGVARVAGWDGYPDAERARSSVAIFGTLILVADRAAWPAMTRQSIQLIRPRLFDVVVVAGLSVAAIVLAALFTLPGLAVAIGLFVALLVLPATRRRFARSLEEALLGDIRQQAAAEAAEDERARLARELHDVPLQELAAVIRRLEIKPGTEAEREDLRALAGHLRNVATELRPPVLDDLGLPAALDFLAEETTTDALPVIATVEDDTGFGADRRPPTDVELAMFRIASEAVGNAIRHSHGHEVRINAAVAPGRVELTIADDGAGLGSQAAREAVRQKRLGLASMRRRAQAIDAELSIDGGPAGTQVRVVWRA